MLGSTSTIYTHQLFHTNQWRLQIARNRGLECMHTAVPGQPWWPSCIHNWHLYQITSWLILVQSVLPDQPVPYHVPAEVGWWIQQDCTQAIWSASNCRTSWCSWQNDTIMWIPGTKLFMRHDHQALQANDRDKGSCREEAPTDFATRQWLQPDSPNVVQQNTCISPTDPIEGGKSQEHWQHNPLCRMY